MNKKIKKVMIIIKNKLIKKMIINQLMKKKIMKII